MVELGSVVKDLVTGLTGVAEARSEYLYGCVRIGVQPMEVKDGEPVKPAWMDEQRVEVTGAGSVKPTPPLDVTFKLGARVMDSLTGFAGIATCKTTFLSGMVTITIEPEQLHEGKPLTPHAFEAVRVALIEEKVVPVSKNSSATSGGPQDDPRMR